MGSDVGAALRVIYLRGAVGLTAIVGEYLVLATIFDGEELTTRGGWGAQLSSVGDRWDLWL